MDFKICTLCFHKPLPNARSCNEKTTIYAPLQILFRHAEIFPNDPVLVPVTIRVSESVPLNVKSRTRSHYAKDNCKVNGMLKYDFEMSEEDYEVNDKMIMR